MKKMEDQVLDSELFLRETKYYFLKNKKDTEENKKFN